MRTLIRRTAAGALPAVALLLGSTAPVLAGKPGHGHGPPPGGKYDANADGVIRMQIREIEWDRQGWPYFSPDA